MIINTKKDLFLNKHPFKALKLTKHEFKERIYNLIEILFNRFNLDTSKLKDRPDLNPAIYSELLSPLINHIINNNDLSIAQIPELQKYYEDTLKVEGSGLWDAGMMDLEDVDGQLQIIELPSGFSFMQVFTSTGDDAYCPVMSCIYFDDNGNIRNYVPYYGNTILPDSECISVPGTMCVAGNLGGEDEYFWKNLVKKYVLDPDDLEDLEDDEEEYSKLCLECYEKKYGLIYEKEDKSALMSDLEDYTDLITSGFNIDINRCYEDIASNVFVLLYTEYRLAD